MHIKQLKIAFITAIMSTYEKTAKPFARQTFYSDFICFTDSNLSETNGWEIDKTSYYDLFPSPLDTGNFINSRFKNNHTFNKAKYYKEQFYLIPRLRDYEIVVWLDGTITINSPDFARYLWNVLVPRNKVVFTPIHTLNHTLLWETTASDMYRYTNTKWNGQKQPFQDVWNQYRTYIANGYVDCTWRERDMYDIPCGISVTCVCAWNMQSELTKAALDMWYVQNLIYTTQDQIAFPYVVQKMRLPFHRAPDDVVIPCRDIDSTSKCNNMWYKYNHGK